MPALIQFGVVVVLLLLGLSVGTLIERRHFRLLARREAALSYILVTDTGSLPPGCAAKPMGIVFGDVVISSDYFKTFAARLKKIIGGELRTFESLMERARREALLRVLESAERLGANRVINVRFATSNIGSVRRRQAGAAMVEMCAYGTAVYVPDDSSR